MLQWVSGDRDVCIWNEIEKGQFPSLMLELDGASHLLARPVFTKYPDWQTPWSMNFH